VQCYALLLHRADAMVRPLLFSLLFFRFFGFRHVDHFLKLVYHADFRFHQHRLKQAAARALTKAQKHNSTTTAQQHNSSYKKTRRSNNNRDKRSKNSQ
jgi:hypothetical protein